MSLFLIETQLANAQEIIHCWDFNGGSSLNTPLSIQHRVSGEGSIIHNFNTIQQASGSITNACLGSQAGQAFSVEGDVNNDQSLILDFSTAGFQDIKLSFAAQSTGFDTVLVEYSTDDGVSWTTAASNLSLSSSYAAKEIDFTSISALNHQPHTQFKISVSGATSATDAIRFDNIKLTGHSIFEGLQIQDLNGLEVITFDEAVSGVMPGPYDASGFSPRPQPGQINAHAMATSGMSDGNSNFGGTYSAGDFARGESSGSVSTGGFYAFEVESGNRAFGFKPTGTDLNPGSITVAVQNQTGKSINRLDLAYDIWVLNSQNRSSTLNVGVSTNNIDFSPIADLNYISPEIQEASPSWVKTVKGKLDINLNQLIPNGEYVYIQFLTEDYSGSGSRDELAIDNISVGLNRVADRFVIDFDEDTQWTAGSGNLSSNQTNHSYTDQDWQFTGGPALRNTNMTQDGFPLALGTYSWRLADATDMTWTATYQGDEVITSFGFDLRRWSESPEVDYSIHYSLDGGLSFQDTGITINNTWLNASSDWTTFEFDLPSIEHTASGDVVVQVKRLAGNRLNLDNFSFETSITDLDSDITAPSIQIPSGDLIVGEAVGTLDAVPVFAFQISDEGTADGLPTLTNRMRFIAGPENTADFSEIIDQVVLRVDGSRIFNNSTRISLYPDEIQIEFDYSQGNASSLLPVPDQTSKAIEVSLSLKTEGLTSGDKVQLAIDNQSLGFGVEPGSSVFSEFIDPVIGNAFDLKVEATQLSFIKEPQYAKVNTPMPFGVTVAATDANGNIDQTATNSMQLTSTGTLSNSPLMASLTNGIAHFEVTHTTTGEHLQLMATDLSGSLSQAISLHFNIRQPLELFISEVADPQDDTAGRFVELFNHGVDAIDFDTEDVFLGIEFNGGSLYRKVKLTGVLEPKSYYLIGRDDFSSAYGFSADIEQPNITLVASGNGNDTYFLSYEGTTNEELIRHFFDIYGEIGIEAYSGTPWFYSGKIAHRHHPPSIEETQIWDENVWTISSGHTTDATPGYSPQDYIYVDDSETWNSYGLGSPLGNSTAQHNIHILDGEVTFNQAITVNDLVIRAGARLILEDQLTVKGDLVNEGEVIFKSDSQKTAVLGQASSRSRITGEFEIQRYFPQSNRAYRYVSSSVTTSTSIRDNWQEGVNRLMPGSEHQQNPNPGFGTHITGSRTGAHGFDATGSGNPSLFEWDVNLQGWNAVSNTDTNTLTAGNPYAFFIRGDRSTDITSNLSIGPATTLRTTGELLVGAQTLNNIATSVGDFTLIGNPYQARVDLSQLLLSSTSGLSTNYIYIYDPTLGTHGGYATVDLSDGSSIPLASEANQFLEPQQAFFVETITAGGTSELQFEEHYKTNSTLNLDTFRQHKQSNKSLDIELYFQEDDTKAVDAIHVNFSASGNDNIDELDATKIWNYQETLAIDMSPQFLSIEHRNLPQPKDSIQLFFGNWSSEAYRLAIKPQNFIGNHIVLFDRYLGTRLKLSSDEVTSYPFQGDYTQPASIASDRFVIAIENQSLSYSAFESTPEVMVYPNPISTQGFQLLNLHSFQHDTVELDLFNLQGKSMFTTTLKHNFSQAEVLLDSNLASGIYLLRLTDKEHVEIIKVMVK